MYSNNICQLHYWNRFIMVFVMFFVGCAFWLFFKNVTNGFEHCLLEAFHLTFVYEVILFILLKSVIYGFV